MHYDLRLRPAQPATPAPDAFTVHRREVPPSEGRDGLTIAFVHEGPEDGYPVVLLHGWPETKRIWWRNIGALADAGYQVIAPDLRGFGDSDLSCGRCLRPGGVEPRHVSARARRAGPSAVRGGRRRSRRRGRRSTCLHRYPGFVEKLVLLQHRAAVRVRRLRRGRHRRRVDPRDRSTGRRPTTATCRARRRTRWRPNSTRRPSAGALHRRDVRAPPVGVAGHVHRATTSTS